MELKDAGDNNRKKRKPEPNENELFVPQVSDKITANCTPLEWAFTLCVDQAHYHIGEYEIVTHIEYSPIREWPIEAIKFGDLKKIQRIHLVLQEVVQEMDGKKVQDGMYILAEEFISIMRNFLVKKRYRVNDSAFMSDCHIDESTGELIETIPNDFWTEFQRVYPENKWKELAQDSIQDVTVSSKEGSVSLRDIVESEGVGVEGEENQVSMEVEAVEEVPLQALHD